MNPVSSARYSNFPFKGIMARGYYHTKTSQTLSRKSRICEYCRKVFTRSTTRRYHEAKCKIKEMGDGALRTSGTQISPVASSYTTSRSPHSYRPTANDVSNNNVPLLPKTEIVNHTMATKQYPDKLSLMHNFITPPASALFEDVSPVNSSPALPPVNWLLPSSAENVIYNLVYKKTPVKQEFGSNMNNFCHKSTDIVTNSANGTSPLPNKMGHHTEAMYQCHNCGSTSSSPKNCHCEHQSQTPRTEHKPYSCIICLTQFTRKYSLKLHEKRHLPPFACNSCQKQFYSVGQLKDHLASHNQLEQINYGDINSIKPDEIKQEMSCSEDEVSDSNDNSSVSDVIMKTKINAEKHEAEAVSEVQKCNQCGQEFAHAYLLKVHVKIHATKPFECPVCGKKFGYRNNMKTHIKCHYGTKAHACDRCGARFTRASTLRRHIEKHFTSGINSRPIKCSTVSGQDCNLPQTSDISHVSLMSPISVMNQIPQTSFVHSGDTNKHYWLPMSINTDNSDVTALPSWPFSNTAADGIAVRNYQDLNESEYNMPLIVDSFEPQTQALNLTTPKNDLQNGKQCTRNESFIYHESLESGTVFTRSATENILCSPDTMSVTESKESDLSINRPTRDVHIQVKSCHCSDLVTVESDLQLPGNEDSCIKGTMSGENSPQLLSTFSGDHIVSTEPNVSSQLFPCIPCGIYFCDYAMLKIHRRLHAPGIYRAFICSLCGEDCRDKVYFSLHINEHLK